MSKIDEIQLYPEMNKQISDLLAMSEEPMYLYAAKYIKQLEAERCPGCLPDGLCRKMPDGAAAQLRAERAALETELAVYREAEKE